jgi:hypothetical protein
MVVTSDAAGRNLIPRTTASAETRTEVEGRSIASGTLSATIRGCSSTLAVQGTRNAQRQAGGSGQLSANGRISGDLYPWPYRCRREYQLLGIPLTHGQMSSSEGDKRSINGRLTIS